MSVILVNMRPGDVKHIYVEKKNYKSIPENLHNYTLIPFLYEHGSMSQYASHSLAGTITWVTQTSGSFYYTNNANVFPSSSKAYDLRIQFSSSADKQCYIAYDDFATIRLR